MKKSSRKGKAHSKHIHAESSFETIKVERNLIQNWLLDLRSWGRENIQFLRMLFLVSVFTAIISLIFIGIYTALIEKQNYQFFTYLNQYKAYKKPGTAQEKDKNLRELIRNCHNLCHTFFKTSHSYNGCLLEAASYIELKEYKKASKPLDMFGQYNAGSGVGVFSLFFAAQAYENLLEFQKAYELYSQIESPLKEVGKDDIAIYNKARILYLQGKLNLAETLFQKIVYEKPDSEPYEASLNFLRLIAFEKNEKISKKSKINTKIN